MRDGPPFAPETAGGLSAPETAGDAWEVEALFDLCFAPGRRMLSSYRLRDGVAPAPDLCRVVRDPDSGGAVAGAIRFWPIRILGGRVWDAMLLGPVAVHPTRQGEGLGAALIGEGLAGCAARGVARVLLVGDAPYYGRFGFRRLRGVTMPAPTNPDRVLGHGAWKGVAGAVERALPSAPDRTT